MQGSHRSARPSPGAPRAGATRSFTLRLTILAVAVLLGFGVFLGMQALGTAPTISPPTTQAIQAAQVQANRLSSNALEPVVCLLAVTMLIGAAVAWPRREPRPPQQQSEWEEPESLSAD